MNIIAMHFYAFADNLVYANSPGDIEIADTSLLEGSMYEEVPDNGIESGNSNIGHKNEETGSTRAILTLYEYATLEPNGTTVINLVV